MSQGTPIFQRQLRDEDSPLFNAQLKPFIFGFLGRIKCKKCDFVVINDIIPDPRYWWFDRGVENGPTDEH